MTKGRKRTAFYKITTSRWAIVNEKIETVEGFIQITKERKYQVQDILGEELKTFETLQDVKKWLED